MLVYDHVLHSRGSNYSWNESHLEFVTLLRKHGRVKTRTKEIMSWQNKMSKEMRDCIVGVQGIGQDEGNILSRQDREIYYGVRVVKMG